MHRELIISAFAKAKNESLQETGREGSTTKASERISAYIVHVGKTPFSPKSLRNLYTNAQDPDEVTEILQSKVLNALCNYIGYDSYQQYLSGAQKGQDKPNKLIKEKSSFLSKTVAKWITLVVVILGVGVCIYFFSNRQRWMEWDRNQYLEVDFNAEKLQGGILKLYKKERIDHFRKVILSCDTTFFDSNGSPLFWYGKNSKKELEFFTDLGRHPETGKTLKPLSKYMIEKYVCVQN